MRTDISGYISVDTHKRPTHRLQRTHGNEFNSLSFQAGTCCTPGMNAWANHICLSMLRPERFIKVRQLLGSQPRSDGCRIHRIRKRQPEKAATLGLSHRKENAPQVADQTLTRLRLVPARAAGPALRRSGLQQLHRNPG